MTHRMSELSELTGRRVKGLDEFETPEFVGRMARRRRRRELAWRASVAASVILGLLIGLTFF